MAAAAESEQVPDGRGADFGRGGCKGIGDASAPSIWDLPRSVGAELEAATASIAAAPDLVAESEEEYRACAAKTAAVDVSSPMDLDAALAADEELGSKAAEIRVSCDAIWADRYNAARATAFADVRDRHAAEFTEVADRYAGVLDTIRGDSDFMDYLASSATLAMSAADLHLDE